MELYIRVKAATLLPLFSVAACFGQELNVGDTLPNIEFNNVFNYSSDKIKLSDFRGKLVILDFWGFTCMSCLKAFPKMDSLQKKFGDKIQVVFVNTGSKDSTRQFFEKRKKLLLPPMPFITKDTVLHKLFAPEGNPFYVWIDNEGVVNSFPETTSINTVTIQKFLSNERPDILEEARTRKKVRSLIAKEWLPGLEYYSYISRPQKEVRLGLGDGLPGYVELIRYNLSAIELYKLAYSEITKYDFDRPGRAILELKDSFQYVRPSSDDIRFDEWFTKYSYTYHLFLPASKKEKLLDFMKGDLNRFFDLEARIEKRKVKCMVLVSTGSSAILKTKGGKPENTFQQMDIRDTVFRQKRLIKNLPFKQFSSRLETFIEYNFRTTFIDATGYDFAIDFEIDGQLLDNIDLPSLQKVLRKYGLDLIEKYRLLEVLVIKSK